MQQNDGSKIYWFGEYERNRKLAAHNDRLGRAHFAERNAARCKEIEKRYPDFSDIFTERERARRNAKRI